MVKKLIPYQTCNGLGGVVKRLIEYQARNGIGVEVID
jgi:hypothetical protein